MSRESAQEEWKRKTLEYAEAINRFVAAGHEKGWEAAGPEPEEPGREALVDDVLGALRRANAAGDLEGFRELWPPAHAPLISVLEEQGQSLPVLCVLDDGSILLRVGSPWLEGRTLRIVGDEVEELPDVGFFGRGPNRRFFAVAREAGVSVHDGWDGPQLSFCPWPSGTEGLPEGMVVEPWEGEGAPIVTGLVPFPDGKRVLMMGEAGVFVLGETEARRLLPRTEEIAEDFEDEELESADEISVAMEHGAVSGDGRFIAVGCQDGPHLVFDAELELIAEIENESEYPHHAVFSDDQSLLALNSCHFYNGVTLGVPTEVLVDNDEDREDDDDRVLMLQEGARVYASASREDEIIIGDAGGYLRAFDLQGERRWEQFIGSTVDAIDLSRDGSVLAASTCAGFVAIFRMDAGEQAPFQIGSGHHREERRWVFWKDEAAPMRW